MQLCVCAHECTFVSVFGVTYMHLWHATLRAGAQLFCYKKLSQKTGKTTVGVELDGVACSDTSCIIVERKQQFRHKEVLEYIEEIDTLK